MDPLVLAMKGVESHTKECYLSPEINSTKEGEVNRDAIEERAAYTSRTNIRRRLRFRSLGARLDCSGMVRAVRLVVWMSKRSVAECLRTKMSVLWRNDHSHRIINCESHQSQHDRGHQKSLWRGMTFSDLEDLEP